MPQIYQQPAKSPLPWRSKRERVCKVCAEPTGGINARYCPFHRLQRRRECMEGIHERPHFHWTPQIDTKLKLIFQHKTRAERNEALHHFAQELRVKVATLSVRASRLGFSRNLRNWSEEEVTLVQRYSRYSIATIKGLLGKAGFERTERAITERIRKLNLAPISYTLTEVAIGFGVDRWTVRNWIKTGLLKSKSAKLNRNDRHVITVGSLRNFIINHPFNFELKKADFIWLTDILTKGRVGGPIKKIISD